MSKKCPEQFEDLASQDDKRRYRALQAILQMTDTPVEWAYEAWDSLAARLTDENSYQRSIGAMVLCNLAKSDPKRRMRKTAKDLLPLMRDEKFVTARQCIQSIWKLAAGDGELKAPVVSQLEKRFKEAEKEKHHNLIRQDVIQSLGKVSAATADPAIMQRARKLIESEKEEKYRKKYAALLTEG